MKGQPAGLEPLLTAAQAADILGVCEMTLRAFVKRGTLPVIKTGRTHKFSPADLRDWIAANRTGGTRKGAKNGKS